MTVEVRYLVVRNGKEVAMYLTKKEADEHDRMLDIAAALAEFIQRADTISLQEDTLEELTIYLSRNREDLVRLLKGAKPPETGALASKEIEKEPKPRRGRAVAENR